MNEGRSKRSKRKGRSYKEVVGAMRAAKDRTAREKKIETREQQFPLEGTDLREAYSLKWI